MSKKVALLAVCLGYFMTILDTTVVNVALQSMQQHLGASVNGVQWVVISYTLAFASLLLSGGTLGERFGNKRMYLAGLLVFTISSLLCGLAPNLFCLIVARFAQGVGAALLVPVTLGLIAELFSGAKEQAKAVGAWGAMGGIGAAMGPVAGGLLVAALSWRSIFLINVPVGLLTIYLSIRSIPSVYQPHKAKLDVPGQAASFVGFGMLTFALLQAKTLSPASPLIIGTLIAGIIAIAIFILIEKRSMAPMMPLRFFQNMSFSAANAVGFLINFAMEGWLFIMSLYLQQQRHLSPVYTGLAILPWGLAVLVTSLFAGRATAAHGPRKPMLIGLAVGAVALIVQFFIKADAPLPWFVVPFAAFGFGMAFTMPAMTVAVVSHAPRGRGSTSSGIVNAIRQLGSSFGVAILGGLVTSAAFIPGLKTGVMIAAGAFTIALIGTLLSVKNTAIS